MNVMKWIVSAWVALLLANANVYAQEAGKKPRQPATNTVYGKLLSHADMLIKSSRPAEAYKLLEPLEFEHAGEVYFDDLIGIAALDSGQPDKATLAFERVMAVDPGFKGARLDMARAYYQLGDMPRAKIEFTTVLNQNPSAGARATIQKYLAEIDARQTNKQTRLSGYVEGALGRDNNANSATSQTQIIGANATIYTLDPNSVKTATSYYGVTAGGEVNYSLNDSWRLYAGGNFRQRGNIKNSQFDSLNLDEQVGVRYNVAANQLRIGLLAAQYNLDGLRYRNASGVSGEWRYALNEKDQLHAFGQHVKYRFSDPLMQANDFNQQAIGAGWRHVLLDGQSTLSGSVYFGAERDVGGRINGAKRFNGLRIGGQTTWNENVKLFASVGAQLGDYDKVNPLFLQQRTDRQYDLTLGADHQWAALWTVRPQLSYSRNQSNIGIYGYNRADISLSIRRDLK